MAIRHLTVDSAGERDSIRSRINDLLPDNNSGRISAADIRVNLEDIVDSIIENVASGDFSYWRSFSRKSQVDEKYRSGN